MFGIVIFYPAGQPIRNRSGAEKCRMHGVPCGPVKIYAQNYLQAPAE